MAQAIIARQSYVGMQVTLTTGGTKYNLKALVDALLAAGTISPDACAQLSIQPDPGNTGTALLVGDGLLSATRYGYSLAKGVARLYQANLNNIQYGAIYVESATSGDKVNVEIMTA